MRLKNKIATILKSKSGVSLMFVLGSMTLLLIIGASVVAAATTNYGSNIRQNQYNRAVVLCNSIHRNIMYSLQIPPTIQTAPLTPPSQNPAFTNSLASQLVLAMLYNHADPKEEFELELTGAAGVAINSRNPNYTITLMFPSQDVRITDPIDAMPELGPPFDERTPRRATVSAVMIVSVVVEVGSTGVARTNERVITTHATYSYNGGELTDEMSPNTTMAFTEEGYGKWELINYEVFESSSN